MPRPTPVLRWLPCVLALCLAPLTARADCSPDAPTPAAADADHARTKIGRAHV